MSLKTMFNDILKLEEINNWIGLNFVNKEDLEEIIDGMDELELREKAADNLGEHIAYTVTINQLIKWYTINKSSLIDTKKFT